MALLEILRACLTLIGGVAVICIVAVIAMACTFPDHTRKTR